MGTPPPTLVNPSPDPLAENLTIHVHKEGGTGGHWCARLIFFALLAILVGLIGVILIEHRGAADGKSKIYFHISVLHMFVEIVCQRIVD